MIPKHHPVGRRNEGKPNHMATAEQTALPKPGRAEKEEKLW